jgi:ATP-dependent Clp protease ATP-binding subunit ClpA
VHYTDEALEAAAKLASRHLRDYRLPDSAIDVLDEAGAKTRLAAPPRVAGEETAIIDVGLPQVEEVVARMARIPAKQASSSDRDRLRSLEESLGRVVFGQDEAVKLVARAIKRSRAGPAADAPRARSCSPAPPASARPSSRNSSRCTSATSSPATT